MNNKIERQREIDAERRQIAKQRRATLMDKIGTIIIRDGKRIFVPINAEPKPIIPNKEESNLLLAIDKLLRRYIRNKAYGKYLKKPIPPKENTITVNESQSLKINRNLPIPKSKITGPLESLPLANALGVRVEIVKQDHHGSPPWIMVDNMRFYFGGGDPTMHFIDTAPSAIPDNVLFLGDAVVPKSYMQKLNLPNVHINSPWGDMIWQVKIPKTTVQIKDRAGWCCLMVRRDHHRDAVASHIESLLKFTPNYFVYDMLDYGNMTKSTSKFDHLIPHMFRDIGWYPSKENKISAPENIICEWNEQCLIEIVTETSPEIFTIGEKICKPIAAGQMFVIIGSHKFLRRLRQMGFKTFHPLIDESYDNEADVHIRAKKAIEAVREFLAKPINNQTAQHLQATVDYNKKRLQHIQQFDLMKHVSKKIKKYIKF